MGLCLPYNATQGRCNRVFITIKTKEDGTVSPLEWNPRKMGLYFHCNGTQGRWGYYKGIQGKWDYVLIEMKFEKNVTVYSVQWNPSKVGLCLHNNRSQGRWDCVPIVMEPMDDRTLP